ncbi:MAG: class i glutamine amidotransferase-like [Verrucomicrobiales bacterium]|nr:class i glutamine amidotransferase-like [Verrucomicrobiales bacterium]
MSATPSALLIKFPGTNCDAETARALEAAGFTTSVVPVSLITPSHLKTVNLVVFSGGFSYGDYVMAGRIAQLVSEVKLGDSLKRFIADGGYVLGICNGFQIMTKLGILPEGSLIDNSSGRFQCRWVKLKVTNPESPWLADLPEEFELPIAHAEGRFVAPEGKAQEYLDKGLAALTYESDINGSTLQIAAMQDETGRVFGLMPHPERFIHPQNHYDPDWSERPDHGWGYYFFRGIWREITGGRRLVA